MEQIDVDFILLDREINNKNNDIKKVQEVDHHAIVNLIICNIFPLFEITETFKNTNNGKDPKENEENRYYYIHNIHISSVKIKKCNYHFYIDIP